jgi:hypothetical protein
LVCIDNPAVQIVLQLDARDYTRVVLTAQGATLCYSNEYEFDVPTTSQGLLTILGNITFIDSTGYPDTNWREFAYLPGERDPGTETVFTFAGIRFRMPLPSDGADRQNNLVSINNPNILIGLSPVPNSANFSLYGILVGDKILCQLERLISGGPSTAEETKIDLNFSKSNNAPWYDINEESAVPGSGGSWFVQDWSSFG